MAWQRYHGSHRESSQSIREGDLRRRRKGGFSDLFQDLCKHQNLCSNEVMMLVMNKACRSRYFTPFSLKKCHLLEKGAAFDLMGVRVWRLGLLGDETM